MLVLVGSDFELVAQMSSILQSYSGCTSSEDGSSNSEGSDPTTMTMAVNPLSASHKHKQASILVMNG